MMAGGKTAAECHDFFRDEFRICKQLTLADIDVSNFNQVSLRNSGPYNVEPTPKCPKRCLSMGLLPTKVWKVTALSSVAGFYFIQNAFHDFGKWYWILRSLVDFTQYPIKSNLTSEALLDTHRYPWKHYDPKFATSKGPNEKKQPVERLRWTTLGYQYNWETKKYYSGHYVDFPSDLATLTRFFVDCVGLGKDYNPETSIVNFYPEGSTLGIHCDNLEWDSSSPLVSISLAHSAIFLLGDADRTKQPIRLLLNSGDVVIMTESCRQRFHAVPKIFITDSLKREQFFDHRAALVRLIASSEELPNESDCENSSYFSCVDEKRDERFENELDKVEEYIRTRRINLNVRQLKNPGDVFESQEIDPRLLNVEKTLTF